MSTAVRPDLEALHRVPLVHDGARGDRRAALRKVQRRDGLQAKRYFHFRCPYRDYRCPYRDGQYKHGIKVMPCGKTHGTRQTTAYNHATWQTTRGGAKRYNNAARRHPVALYFTSSASAAAGEQLITIIVLALPPSTGCTGAAQRYPECSYA